MRKGKIAAQAAHASNSILLQALGYIDRPNITKAMEAWLNGSFTKICVYVTSEQELLDLYAKAVDAGLYAALITDNGLTEFNGVKTNTCIAIGPAFPDEIDHLTGHLPLL